MKKVKQTLAFSLCALAVILAIIIWRSRVDSAASAMDGSSHTGPGDNESYSDKLIRYRAGAWEAARSECTNEVTGLRGIISLDVDASDQNFMHWTATATVEYINHIGGVDRTNLSLRFDPTYTGQPTWFPQD